MLHPLGPRGVAARCPGGGGEGLGERAEGDRKGGLEVDRTGRAKLTEKGGQRRRGEGGGGRYGGDGYLGSDGYLGCNVYWREVAMQTLKDALWMQALKHADLDAGLEAHSLRPRSSRTPAPLHPEPKRRNCNCSTVCARTAVTCVLFRGVRVTAARWRLEAQEKPRS
eukprot:3840099-Rhodomonas_salina.1